MDREIIYALALLSILFITAIVVYHDLEGWDWIDAAYFAASTITTVGYGDLTPTNDKSKLFTILYMLIGVSTGLYVMLSLGKYRDSALRSRFDHLFESMTSLHSPIKIKKKKPDKEGKFILEKVR